MAVPHVAHTWNNNDVITATLLNTLETDLAAAGISTVTATALAAGATPTATISNGALTLGLPAGAAGIQGLQGIQGIQGLTGLTGTTGLTGAQGPAPVLNIGTVTTVAAGSSATATITGTSPNYTLNLGIPVGATGAAGSGTGSTGAAVLQWQASTAYTAGQIIVSPAGQVVSAIAGFTSGATYSSANWTVLSVALAGTNTLTAAGTMIAGRINLLDGTAGAFTATLPTPAYVGQEIEYERVDTGTNLISIGGTIRGVASAATLPGLGVAGEAMRLVAESTNSWRITSSHKPTALLLLQSPRAHIYDIRNYVNPGETLAVDGTIGNNSAILNRAIVALNALFAADAIPRQIFVPNGKYKLAQTAAAAGNFAVNYAVQRLSGVGIVGESRAGTIFLSDNSSTPFTADKTVQMVDLVDENYTVDCTAQYNSGYTTGLKGSYMADMLRPVWRNVAYNNAWSTGLGCDFLVDYRMENVIANGNGRQIAALSLAPESASGSAGIGIGTGKYQIENGTIANCTTNNNGKWGIFWEKQSTGTYYVRGVKVIGHQAVGNYIGLQDAGCDGLDADIDAVSNTCAGISVDATILASSGGFNGRITGRFDRNGSTTVAESGNVRLGAMPTGFYTITGTAKNSPTYGVITRSGAAIGPRIMINVAAERNGYSGVYVQPAAAAIARLGITGSAASNGQGGSGSPNRAGVLVNANTTLLLINIDASDEQTTVTQQVGVYLMGSSYAATAPSIKGDARGSVAAITIEQTVTNPIYALDGANLGVVTGVTLTAGAAQLVAQWSAPLYSGDVTDYSVRYGTDGTTWTTTTVGGTGTTKTITGLINGTVYQVQVAPIRSGTLGTYSASATGTPISNASAFLIGDSFVRADNASSLGSTDSGSNAAQAWAVTASTTWQIASNYARSASGGLSVATIDSGITGGTTTMVVGALNSTIANRISDLVIRYVDDSNYLYLAPRSGSTDGHWALGKRLSGTSTTLFATTILAAAGDVVKLVDNGSTVTVYINGVNAGNNSITSFNTATRKGFRGFFTTDASGKLGAASTSTLGFSVASATS